MSDYISREAANDTINETAYEYEDDEAQTALYHAADRLNDLPAADVVEVVRKPVPGYEGYYEVDQFGRVYSLERVVSVDDNGRKYRKPISGKLLKQRMHTQGYKAVSLTKAGKTKSVYVHRIVAMAFLPNPNELPFINHIDEDKTNNFVENLEWCTVQYNNTYGGAIERRVAKIRGRTMSDEQKRDISAIMKAYQNGEEGAGKRVVCLETGEEFTSIRAAAEHYGMNPSTVGMCCLRRTNGRKYTFRYCADGKRKNGGQDDV